MATGKIPVQGGSVIDVEPIPASSSNPNPHNYYDISMKYVSGIVFFSARIALSSAGGPYSHYCIPAQYVRPVHSGFGAVLGGGIPYGRLPL